MALEFARDGYYVSSFRNAEDDHRHWHITNLYWLGFVIEQAVSGERIKDPVLGRCDVVFSVKGLQGWLLMSDERFGDDGWRE